MIKNEPIIKFGEALKRIEDLEVENAKLTVLASAPLDGAYTGQLEEENEKLRERLSQAEADLKSRFNDWLLRGGQIT